MTGNKKLSILSRRSVHRSEEEKEMEKMLILVLGAAFVLLLVLAFLVRYNQFREEMDYIELELARCSPRSRKYWKRQKRRLWLWLLFGIPRK